MLQRPLTILMTADPDIPVPPTYYGGIERVVGMLICNLARRGHTIHLFAHPESKVPAKLISHRNKSNNSLLGVIQNALQLKEYVKEIGKLDIIHSFGRLAHILFLMHSKIPKIQSYQRHVTPRNIALGKLLAGQSITFTACSEFCVRTAKSMDNEWVIIPNGVPIEKYQFNGTVKLDAPLVFLGRVERIKGVHTAIQVAKMSGRRLIIAGNHASAGPEHDYFVKEILPYCDGADIRYIGPVDDSQKNQLLGHAAALLFPIEWGEPFGIVMAESLACGTPVIAFEQGSVPEVIRHRETGFICRSIQEMTDSVNKIPSIQREECRMDIQRRFSDEVITDQYERLYYSCLKP